MVSKYIARVKWNSAFDKLRRVKVGPVVVLKEKNYAAASMRNAETRNKRK